MTRLFPPDADCVARIHAQFEYLLNNPALAIFSKPNHRITREQLSTLIEIAFWASLKGNEGRTTRVRLTVIAPEHIPRGATVFATPVAYEESTIVKLSPAVPLDCSLGVVVESKSLKIWGFADRVAIRSFDTIAIEITEPGTVRVDVGVFRPYAVLDGQANEVIEAAGSNLTHYLQQKLKKAFPENDILEVQAIWRECGAVPNLVRMILSDGHGGAILIVPSEDGEWTKSLEPFPYRLKTPDSTVRDAIRKNLLEMTNQGKVLEELSQAPLADDLKNRLIEGLLQNRNQQSLPIGAIASLAKVDGAVVMTRDMQLLGFGAKIKFRQHEQEDVPICMFKPTPCAQKIVPSHLEDLGGMRHQSAARFIAANKDAVAIIVSQDRHISVMNWEDTLSSVCVMRNAEWWV
jgi:hypothetical protein